MMPEEAEDNASNRSLSASMLPAVSLSTKLTTMEDVVHGSFLQQRAQGHPAPLQTYEEGCGIRELRKSSRVSANPADAACAAAPTDVMRCRT